MLLDTDFFYFVYSVFKIKHCFKVKILSMLVWLKRQREKNPFLQNCNHFEDWEFKIQEI